jgi:RNase P/RNase MRP subunit p30
MEGKVIIQEDNFEKARKLIHENSGKRIIFSSEDEEVNKKVLEKENIEILLLNQSNRKDFHKQRNSGFNHVMAKIAKKKGVIIGINLDELVKSSEKEKAAIIGRIRQNIKICNKNKLKMKFIYKNQKRDIYDLTALGLVLGMPTNMLKSI